VTEPAKKLSLAEMAELLEKRFLARTKMLDRTTAHESFLIVEKADAEALKQVVAALEYLAPHAEAIKRAIGGK
jgi:hypothetical protein